MAPADATAAEIPAGLAGRVAAWLAARLGVPGVEVADLFRIPGGASRETYRLVARVPGAGERRLILRRHPGMSLIETEQAVEFAAFRAFQDSDVPVPTLVGIEDDPSWLDRPFFVMDEVTGCVADGTLLETAPYLERKAEIGRHKWAILGVIAKADPHAIGLVGPLAVPRGEAVWRDPLDYWEGVIDADALSPQPVARAAIRWLRRNPPPPPAKLSVVHGDFRTGNFLFDATGRVRAILDWEMCHLGDPLEDLAWAFNPLWAAGSFETPGRLVPRAEAIRLWEAASGIALDPVAFHWWEIFAGVKGLAIWQSAAAVYAEGSNRDPIQLAAGWFCTDPQDRHLMQLMGHPA